MNKKNPMTQRTPKKSKLEKGLEGKPKITLKPLKKTAVNTPTQEKYNTLMQVYECGGRRWVSGHLPTQNINWWDDYQERTCISMKTKFQFASKQFYQKKRYKVISTQEFYDEQNITPENIDKINKWFNEHSE